LHIALIGVAPFLVIGIDNTISVIMRVFNHSRGLSIIPLAKPVTILVMTLFILFESGLIFEVTNDTHPTSLPLTAPTIDNTHRQVYDSIRIRFRSIWPSEQEVVSAQWLGDYRNIIGVVYATLWDVRVPSLQGYGGISQTSTIPLLPITEGVHKEVGYIYMGFVNTTYGYGATHPQFLLRRPNILDPKIWDISDISAELTASDKIYTNRTSEIYGIP